MKFSVDSHVLAKEKKKLSKWKFGIFGFAVATFATAINFFSDDVQALADEAEGYRRYANVFRGYDSYYNEMIGNADRLEFAYIIYLLMLVISTVMLIVSVYKYFKNRPLYNNYLQSYLEINGDTITGLAFHSAKEEGYPFSVNVSELTYVFYYSTSPLNLKFCTKSQSYTCLNIERASEIARKLKQRMTELKENSAENV